MFPDIWRSRGSMMAKHSKTLGHASTVEILVCIPAVMLSLFDSCHMRGLER